MPEEPYAREYMVVRNNEEQHSLWPIGRELPLGWHEEGKHGTREECLDHIERIWTDMRPLSSRRRSVQ
ncbi:MbtH family protein [Streptomyces violaceusniger]|uniref:MbtH family protein n=1 Tax=Streptomyces violaceusniger TaxID=68280 RepID=UPI0002DCE99C|nr:MbtH family NRPS accessory protein [Streptomyces violaceusniger]